ncbi:MAG: type II toxin-antitoxin system VapC family toxin [Acidobacteria bacterium]|nr:type II toxin-antitoxin system VapC family toxin [Acidobacteriota bacterium]
MTAPLFVPDASVLLKWVLASADEEDVARAFEIRAAWLDGRCQLIVPSLWVFEVGNILTLKRPRVASQLLAVLVACQLTEADAARITGRACALCAKHGVTFYDAAYHAAALEYGGTLVTADGRYAARTASSGSVVRLRDWTLSG